MKMFCFRLIDREGLGQCEECAKTLEYQQLYGVLSSKDIQADIQAGNTGSGSKREVAEYLLQEQGLGQILCMHCINKKRAKT